MAYIFSFITGKVLGVLMKSFVHCMSYTLTSVLLYFMILIFDICV